MSNNVRRRAGARPGPAPKGLDWKRVGPLLGLALVAGLLLGGPIGAATARSDSDRTADAVAELRAADAKRDHEQIGTLTDQARRVRESLLPVLEGMAKTLPVGSSSLGPVADRGAVTGWQATAKKAVDEFADPPSAGTAVNVARAGLAAAVRQLDLAVATYAAALDVPDPQKVFALAARQRDSAVTTWSVAATQLDAINVDSGRGHAHVFLPAQPGQGALTADGSPEGK